MSTTSSLITLKQEVEHDSPLIDASRNALNHGRYDSLPQTFKRVLNEGGNGALGEFGEFFVYLTSQWYPLLEQGKWRELCRVEDAFAKEPPPSDAFLELLNPVLDDCLQSFHRMGTKDELYFTDPTVVGYSKHVQKFNLFSGLFAIIHSLLKIGWLKCDHICVRVISWALEYDPEELDHFDHLDPYLDHWDKEIEYYEKELEKHDRKAYASHAMILSKIYDWLDDSKFLDCLVVKEGTASPKLYHCGPLYAEARGINLVLIQYLVTESPIDQRRIEWWKSAFKDRCKRRRELEAGWREAEKKYQDAPASSTCFWLCCLGYRK